MPNHKNTSKMLRKDAKRYLRNRMEKSKVRTLIKRVRSAIKENDLDAAKAQMQRAASALDSAAKKRLLHPNSAARHKSRLMHKLSQLEQSQAGQSGPAGEGA